MNDLTIKNFERQTSADGTGVDGIAGTAELRQIIDDAVTTTPDLHS